MFRDRHEAGRDLAERLRGFAGRDDVVVVALPRGGVPVAFEIARVLGAPLDVLVVRKLGVPGRPELAMGAIASGDIRVTDRELIADLGVSEAALDQVLAIERAELEHRERKYRGHRAAPEVEGRVVILVDDGLATGSTVRAALLALHKRRPMRTVIAAPVGAPATCDSLRRLGHEVVCLDEPESFHAVGHWYEDFSPPSDDEIGDLLRRTA